VDLQDKQMGVFQCCGGIEGEEVMERGRWGGGGNLRGVVGVGVFGSRVEVCGRCM